MLSGAAVTCSVLLDGVVPGSMVLKVVVLGDVVSGSVMPDSMALGRVVLGGVVFGCAVLVVGVLVVLSCGVLLMMVVGVVEDWSVFAAMLMVLTDVVLLERWWLWLFLWCCAVVCC